MGLMVTGTGNLACASTLVIPGLCAAPFAS